MSASKLAHPDPPALVVGSADCARALGQLLAGCGVAPAPRALDFPAVTRLTPLGACGLNGWTAELTDGRRMRARSVVLVAVRGAPRPLAGGLGDWRGRLMPPALDGVPPVAGQRILVVDRDERRARRDVSALLAAGAEVHLSVPEGCAPMRRPPTGVVQHGEVIGSEGQLVRFSDRSAERYQIVITPLHRPVGFPALDPGLLDWDDGHPRLVASMLVPGLANLYVHGVDDDEPGRRIRLLAAMITLQLELDHPLVDDLLSIAQPSCDEPGERARRALRRVERSVRRRTRTRRRSLVLQPGAPVPLDAARAA